MKKLIALAFALLLCGAFYMAADTTFSWSNSNQTGTLTYTGLGLSAPVITGAITVDDVTAAGTATPAATNAPALVSLTDAVYVNVTIGGEVYVLTAYQLDD